MNTKHNVKVTLTEENGREWTGEMESDTMKKVSENIGMSYTSQVGDIYESLLKASNEYQRVCKEQNCLG